ncbi:GTP pyrophosphokinase [Candidatus Kinetoplastibacterium blastocrithidii TCC012E]|uniref:GTP pyrophosphokinase n=1 Tax=Candidatus Kinetoplastidibacterium blastocrithidiae TCC012E TaxID=1208922 RepID=M1LWJ6_9PROT|nr:bifunctional (p)ppGpp synthetase/guanosine-3',5'-bis(diphosphate) 3'-pyrophosphohydrolase [Candidatus Kinetoplastibacterium blastocrithidii]AFZ83777.1 hypothetical protein CKBE_00588 [Candidatus Kinetoplastibacterium blastocrithidii (ex Strigomonas culicis)]AGF49902.1 GTP pyrophosphokinase [Candidatus Kinetoplastibacterium blastocrithidii TCC012E]
MNNSESLILSLPISKITKIDSKLSLTACSCFYAENSNLDKMSDIVLPLALNTSILMTISNPSIVNIDRNLHIYILSSIATYDFLVTNKNNLSFLNFFNLDYNESLSICDPNYNKHCIDKSNNNNRTLKNMFLAMKVDFKAILYRFLSRLHTLSYPCIYKTMCVIEDMAFKTLYPEQYDRIALLFDGKKVEHELFIENTLSKIRHVLDRYGIKAEITGRLKHIYSIWNKMLIKNVDFAKLYDLSALRIVVKDVKTCYMVLDIVHKLWSHIPEEFDDYISRPKPNGYQSLHTVVIDKYNYLIEIQIRTGDMHNFAEYGLAAHWYYKKFRKISIDNIYGSKLL